MLKHFFNLGSSSLITFSTPRTFIIDAGHGVPDEGAESSNGITEAESNLKIALKVQNLLEQSGATVILTRSDENAIYDLDKNTLREKKTILLKEGILMQSLYISRVKIKLDYLSVMSSINSFSFYLSFLVCLPASCLMASFNK